jgi:hypothetical protein
MRYRWHYFLAAVFFSAYWLVTRGAPILPVAAGCVLAALFTWRKIARSART